MDNNSWVRRDLAVLWHPCTQMHDHESLPPVPVASAEGAWLTDFEGRRYLDAISSWWVNLFGHRHPPLVEAIAKQLQSLEHVLLAGFSHAPAIELAEALVRITPPGLDRVFYADNGSSGVEVALKMSAHAWRNLGQPAKTRFVALSGSYHGETLGALGVSDLGLYRDVYAPLLREPLIAPSPDGFGHPRAQWADVAKQRLQVLDQLLAERAHEIAAVIIEPLVQCAAGMRMHDAEYLRGLRRLCDHHQVHLIADEIAVGFGRTGSLFACEQADISPDFLCLSKGLTGGFLPLAAVLTHERIYAAFYDRYETLKGFLHSHSYTGNPLACAVALASVREFDRTPWLQRVGALGQRLEQCMQPLAELPHVGEVRRTGLIGAVEMVRERDTLTPWHWSERRGLRVYRHALSRGVVLRPLGNVVYFMPPYCVSEDEIALMVDVAREGIEIASRD